MVEKYFVYKNTSFYILGLLATVPSNCSGDGAACSGDGTQENSATGTYSLIPHCTKLDFTSLDYAVL